MKLYLVKNQKATFSNLYSYNREVKCQKASLNVVWLQTKNENGFFSDEDCFKLMDLLDSEVLKKKNATLSNKGIRSIVPGENNPALTKNWTVHIEMATLVGDSSKSVSNDSVAVYGDTSGDCIEMITNVANAYSCEAKIQVSIARGVNAKRESVLTHEMEPVMLDSKITYGCMFEGLHLSGWEFSNVTECHYEVSVFVAFHKRKTLSNCFTLFSPEENVNHKMLQKEIGCDVYIRTADGVHVKCHKAFLIAHSKVFEAMLKEPMVSVIETAEMSRECVKAFLEYLYYNETIKAQGSCVVVYSLFRAGYKYGISTLVDRMKFILLSKPDDWFQVELAVKLFRFSRNIEDGEKLKLKAVRGIVAHRGVLPTTEEYLKLYKEDCEAAMELFKCVVSTIHA